MGEFTEFAVWVIILGLMALFTWVRKAIEKASAGKDGEKVDVAKAVQEKLRVYMQSRTGGRPRSGIAGLLLGQQEAAPPPEEPPPQAPPKVVKPVPPKLPLTPTRLVDIRETPKRQVLAQRPRLRKEGMKGATVVSHARHDRFTKGSIRHAIIMAEVLGPPVSERKGDRLF